MKVLSVQKNSKNCIICGMENTLGLQAVFHVLDDNSVASVFSFKNEHQSYPERTHGGMISSLLDEIMGRALWINEPTTYGVTTTLSVTFRKPVPIDVKVKARGYVTFDSKIGFSAKGEIYSLDGVLLAEAQAKYLKMSSTRAFGDNFHEDDQMCYHPKMIFTQIDFPDKKN